MHPTPDSSFQPGRSPRSSLGRGAVSGAGSRSPTAEAGDLNSLQSGFESQREHCCSLREIRVVSRRSGNRGCRRIRPWQRFGSNWLILSAGACGTYDALLAAVDSTTAEVRQIGDQVETVLGWADNLPERAERYAAICIFDADDLQGHQGRA
jgi:hypothetical protein